MATEMIFFIVFSERTSKIMYDETKQKLDFKMINLIIILASNSEMGKVCLLS